MVLEAAVQGGWHSQANPVCSETVASPHVKQVSWLNAPRVQGAVGATPFLSSGCIFIPQMRDDAQTAGGGGHGSPQFDPKASVHPSPRGSHLAQSYGRPTVKGREVVRGTLSAWPLSTCDPASEKGKKDKPVVTTGVSRNFRPKANMSIGSRGPEGIGHELGESLCGAAGVGYQLGRNLRVLPPGAPGSRTVSWPRSWLWEGGWWERGAQPAPLLSP